MRMSSKLKPMNKNGIVNNSHSSEEVEEGICFLNGVTFVSLQSTIVNYADVECINKKEHIQWNAVILKGNRKIIALKKLCGLVDSETKGVNSCKSQYERAIGNVKRSRQIIITQLREI